MPDKQHVFEAHTHGYALYRIPCLQVTPRGIVLAAAEARRGDGGDWADNDVVMRRSTDGGVTWQPMRVLLRQADYGAGPVSNFVMVADQHTGATHVLYCHNYARVFYVCSDDDGESFSQPIDITSAVMPLRQQYPWRVIATGPGHGLQLRSGRMIVPLWMSDGSGTEFGAGRLGHRPSAVVLIYSDDHGRTWRAGEIVVRNEQHRNPSETVAVELSDGRVMFNIRTEADDHRRLVSISPDGVSGWSTPYFDDALLEPVCMASMIRCRWQMEDRAGVILFANPDNLEQTHNAWAAARDRKRLTVKLSYDDAATWTHSKVLEPGPAGYSDLAVLPDGNVLCLYESGGMPGHTSNAAITLARFDINWVAELVAGFTQMQCICS